VDGSKDQFDLRAQGLHRQLWWRTAVAGSISFVIPFALFLALANSASDRHVRAEVSAQLKQGLSANVAVFQQQLQARVREAESFAQELSRASGSAHTWPAALQRFAAANPTWRSVAVRDSQGKIVASSRPGSGGAFDGLLSAQALAGKTVFSGLAALHPGSSLEFTLATPIRDARNSPAWALLATLRLDQDTGRLFAAVAGPGADSFLVNDAGQLVAAFRDQSQTAAGQPFAPKQTDLINGDSGLGEVRDFRGEDVLSAYRRLAPLPSYLVAAIPTEAIQGEVRALRKTILLYVAPFLALGVLLAGLAWYYAMNRIQRLSQDLFGALVVARQRENERDLALQELGRRFDEERELNKQRSQFEARLADYEKYAALAQLALGAAHEINNPLLGILSHLELELRAATAEEHRTEIKQCIEGIKRISSTVRGLLNYARPGPLKLVHVNLNDLVSETLAFLNHHPLFRGIQMRTEIPGDVPTITADANQLSQILMNLLLNAAQAMPEGGIITIAAEKVKFSDKVHISISDTGCGIPADILPQIFRPFFTTKRGRGTGLGLSITQSYVRGHGGDIQVESIPDRGTTVRITLPIRQEGRLVSEMEEVIV
jgi:signal transduction histidine kinase